MHDGVITFEKRVNGTGKVMGKWIDRTLTKAVVRQRRSTAVECAGQVMMKKRNSGG